MTLLQLIIFVALIALGALFLLIVAWREKKRQTLNKYLHKQKKEDKSSTSLLEWLDDALPSSLAQNEAVINQKMINAGIYSFPYSHLYLPLKLSVMLIGCGVLFS